MQLDLFSKTTEQRSLGAAWRRVYANGVNSRSSETQEEVKRFAIGADKNIRRIQRELRNGLFVFVPATGKRIPKKAKGNFRPIVVAPIETRIVQRAVLDRLLTSERLTPFIETPFSFGGIRKRQDEEHAAVPAAINKILELKSKGLEYARCADIASFFTRISKSEVRKIIADAEPEERFLSLYDRCVNVELSNLSTLREHAQRFPIGDLGVAQGSALSPLLGNILLFDFDRQMNKGDCKCIRYIDDLIILGPTEQAVNASFRRAGRLLERLGMEFAPIKSSNHATTFIRGISFLGIDLINGLIRPDAAAISRLKQKIKEILDNSRQKMTSEAGNLPPGQALLPTLNRLSGTIVGWAKHYRFCNDMTTFAALDRYIDEAIREYLGAYTQSRKSNPDCSRRLLGVGLLERFAL